MRRQVHRPRLIRPHPQPPSRRPLLQAPTHRPQPRHYRAKDHRRRSASKNSTSKPYPWLNHTKVPKPTRYEHRRKGQTQADRTQPVQNFPTSTKRELHIRYRPPARRFPRRELLRQPNFLPLPARVLHRLQSTAQQASPTDRQPGKRTYTRLQQPRAQYKQQPSH